jgi:ligand-binding SRPBCC domain-containing protein
MYAGQIIQYKVTPLLGITISWMTEISFVKENSYFVDEQRPYALWHHKHFFEATENGTKMMLFIMHCLWAFRKDNEHPGG